jgi:O-antigen ligase
LSWLKRILVRLKTVSAWNWLCLGLGSVVFSPLLGAICVLGVTIRVWWQQPKTLFHDPAHRVLWILGAGLTFTACFSEDRGNAFLGLVHFWPYFLVFAALRSILTTPQRLQKIAWILVLAALPVNLIGIGQLFWGWAGPISFLPWIQWSLNPTGNPAGRMSSVFAYANVLAGYLVMIWPLAIGLGVEIFRLRSQPKGRQEKLAIAILGLVLVSTAIALILTNSRNAWAIAMIMTLAYALYLGWHWVVAGFSLIVATVMGAAFAPPPLQAPLQAIVPAFFWARLNDQLYPNRPVEQLRGTQWEFTWSMATQRPLTGWGLRSFSSLYEAKTGLLLGHPHNLYLMMAAETGLITTALLIGFVGWVLWREIQQLAQLPGHSSTQLLGFMYLTAFLSTSLFHFLDIPLFDLRINLLGWLLLAGLAGYQPQEKDTDQQS